MLSITSDKADQQKAAWTFMKFLYEPANVATWTRGTGYVPETTDAANDAELGKLLSEDSMFKAANSTIKSLVPWTPWPGTSGLQAEQIVLDMRDQVLGGGADVASTMKTFQDKVNAVIK